ncbi:microtubule-associated protein RP/EB family member 1-like [Drosophila serrata]|uniref:microtubule-associated protein RP/EB family member 1-like n=1 Tax=Drosophila serrata TaxID=7274 RepID=UPI000A1D1EDC|nr:microtubule-associated protein RP/EB family member 1-like [Drosophila serrata]
MLSSMNNRAAVNVYLTSGRTSEDLSRLELLDWVNESLKAQFTKIDELCTGAAYCQFMDMLFPNIINMDRVKCFTNEETDFKQNFKILEASFKKMSVDKQIPSEKLIKRCFQHHLQFLKWFKKFFDANYEGRSYDPRAVRGGAPMGFGAESISVNFLASTTPFPIQGRHSTSNSARKSYWEQVKPGTSEKVTPMQMQETGEGQECLAKKMSHLKLRRTQSW